MGILTLYLLIVVGWFGRSLRSEDNQAALLYISDPDVANSCAISNVVTSVKISRNCLRENPFSLRDAVVLRQSHSFAPLLMFGKPTLAPYG